MKHIHIKIDEKLKQKAQIKCLKEKTTLTDLITDFIKKWIKNDESI